MPLRDGARIAVIGAGPAGSMLSYFLLNMAESVALRLAVDLYEPREFCHPGPAGCNQCGGVISESLVQLLATEGITLPDRVVQTGLESYTLHMDVGDVQIAAPLQESRIASIYRGNGPRNSGLPDGQGFDSHLYHLAIEHGARPLRRLVSNLRNRGDTMRVECADGSHQEYELVAIASGINSQLFRSLHDAVGDHELPALTRTFICEFQLGREVTRTFFGPSMHVFLLDIPRLKCAALIPKGDYVTLCLLGDDVDDQLIDRFFSAPEVGRCFPGGMIPRPVCHCYPRINVRTASPPYGDRLVMVGDSGTTRLFKDGIGAAYRTAKAAARTAVFHGVSSDDFHAYYWPLCKRIEADNRVGKLLFRAAGVVQHSHIARQAVLRMVATEQQQSSAPRRMSGVLWDLFSGSAPYTDVLQRALLPGCTGGLASMLVSELRRKGARPAFLARHGVPANKCDQPQSLRVTQPMQMHARQTEKTPPCQVQCPASGDIPGWLGVIAQRAKLGLSLEQAYDRAWEKLVEVNPFPATLGRICPHPCESSCNRNSKDGAVSINAMERFLGEWGISRRLALPRIATAGRAESVGVIGAGPASLSFAYQLARRGYPVTIYEKRERPGGVLRHAIPDFRLPRHVVDAEIRRILDLPISLRTGVQVGRDVSFDELKARHQLLFLGIGAQLPRRLAVEGVDGPGVLSGIEYLTRRKLGQETGLGRRVVVIGAGDTAIDAARSARRDGAEVTLLYRRGPEEMPARPHETWDAAAEQVRFEFLSEARRILRSGPSVTGVEAQRMRLGEADEGGRRRPIPIPDAVLALEADTVLAAVSQEPDWHGLDIAGRLHEWLVTGSDGRVSDDIWAGGDVCGTSIASRAIAQGRIAAEAAHARIGGEAPAHRREARPTLDLASVTLDSRDELPRTPTSRRPVRQWLDDPELEIDQTFTSDQAMREASRCLSCGTCFGCQLCFMYCSGAGFTRLERPEPGRYYALAPEICEGCGRCIDLCSCACLEIRNNADR